MYLEEQVKKLEEQVRRLTTLMDNVFTRIRNLENPSLVPKPKATWEPSFEPKPQATWASSCETPFEGKPWSVWLGLKVRILAELQDYRRACTYDVDNRRLTCLINDVENFYVTSRP